MTENCKQTRKTVSSPFATLASARLVNKVSCFGVMGAFTDAQIKESIAQQVEFYKAASAKKSTAGYAHSEVQETYISGNTHLTGSNKPPSTQTENHQYVWRQSQTQRVFLDENPASKKWAPQDNDDPHPRPHHGQELVDSGKSVAELKCNEISTKFQSNQLHQADGDRSLKDRRTNLPASQPEATVTQPPNNVEVRRPELKPNEWEEDDPSPGMDESRDHSDVSCETEDSCDYSSGTEERKAAFTPSSKRFLQEAANSFQSKNEDELATVQKAQSSSVCQKLKPLVIARKKQRNGEQTSKETSVITIDSDPEDECVASSLMEVIVIDSDTEDDGDQSVEESTAERASSSVGEDAVILVTPSHHGRRENKTAKSTITSADLLQSGSQHQNTQEDTPEDTEEGAGPCCDSLNGAQLSEPKDVCDKVEDKIAPSQPFERTRDFTSRSQSGDDSSQSTPSSPKNRENRETDLQSKKVKLSFGNSAKTLPLEVPPPADFSTAGSKKTNPSEKSQLWSTQNKGEHLSKLKLGNPPKPSVEKNVEQQGTQSKRLSPTTRRDLSTSTCRSILSSRKNCEAGQSSPSAEGSSRSEEPTSTNCSRKNLKRVTFAPGPHSPSKRLARSISAPSTSGSTSVFGHQAICPKGFSPYAPTKISPRMKVLDDWARAHYPTRIERKYHQGAEQNVETTSRTTESVSHPSNAESDGPVRPELAQHSGVPRQRRRSQDSNTSLMKRCKSEAMEWSKAIHRRPAGTNRSAVGVGYKWSERPSASKSTEDCATE